MARTLNPVTHAVRRDAFVDAAQALIQSKGYEVMSVQDVIDELKASRGAFYHYFEGKSALLDAVVERMVDEASASVQPIMDDPSLTAPEKLSRFLLGITSWKLERTELLLAVMQVWFADENAIVRERFRKRLVARVTPILAPVVEQGRREGTFDVTSADGAARVLVSLLQAANEAGGQLFIARQADTVSFDEVVTILTAYGDAFERVLGAPHGTYPQFDPELLKQWFG